MTAPCLPPSPFTADEVANLISHILNYQTQPCEDFRVYTLAEVAELTHFSARSIGRLCAAGEVECFKPAGRVKGMTAHMIAAMIRKYSVGGSEVRAEVGWTPPPMYDNPELEAARLETLRRVRPSRKRKR